MAAYIPGSILRMLTFELCTALLLSAYCILILYYRQAWKTVPVTPDEDFSFTGEPVSVSVIVPARNESAGIGKCLDALFAQDYPKEKMEIIVVDDHSTDDTAAIAAAKGATVVHLSLSEGDEPVFSFKKKAIQAGISAAKGELIVCTDADCTAGKSWIAGLSHRYRLDNSSMLAGPVRIRENGSALAVFQILDFVSLQGITGAAVSRNLYPMANGANLAYSRESFEAVGGFSGIDHIASGDDMLLMKKMQDRFPRRQVYVKQTGAIVTTMAAENLRAFFRQRIRWASKTAHYGHPATMATLALVYLVNLLLLSFAVFCFFSGAWDWLLTFLIVKTAIEMLFVAPVAGFFGQRRLMIYFPLCQPFHIIYTVLAGTFGALGKVTWKDRVIR